MRLVSHVGRAIRKAGLNTTEFARESGIARSTLEKLIGNHFSEIRRDTIERLAARLRIHDINELFSLQEDERNFLEPFHERKSVTFLFGTHEVTDAGGRRDQGISQFRTGVDQWDFRTKNELMSFLRQREPELRDEMRFYSKESFGQKERDEALELVRRHNTVIVGSPKVNPACEAVLSALFRSKGKGKGRGPRFALSDDDRMAGSVLGIGGFDEVGVVDVAEGRMVAACSFEGAGKPSQDAGILHVVYRPLGTSEEVLCILASGVSGCGTYGVIRALVENPPESSELAPGLVAERAVQTIYRKPTPSLRDDREVVKVVTLPA
jgi:hypothetical protein